MGLKKWPAQWLPCCSGHNELVTHICVGKLTIIGSDNGLSPGRHQAIIWTNAGILLIEPWETNFSKILIEIHTFSLKKMHLKMLFGKWQPFCLSLNVLKDTRRDRSCRRSWWPWPAYFAPPWGNWRNPGAAASPDLRGENRHFDGLEQERRNSCALAMELRLSCTNLSIF